MRASLGVTSSRVGKSFILLSVGLLFPFVEGLDVVWAGLNREWMLEEMSHVLVE